jgi:nitronate monooxygenase
VGTTPSAGGLRRQRPAPRPACRTTPASTGPVAPGGRRAYGRLVLALDRLPVPIVQAPLARRVATPALVAAVAEAGALGFLAGGYLTAAELAADVAALRRRTAAPFGVNLFAPQPCPATDPELDAYRARLLPEAERLGVALPPVAGVAARDDDDWAAKLDLLLAHPVPVASFTFGLPAAGVLAALRERDTAVVVTVTTVAEARRAATAGADALCVQGPEAGGHRGTFDPAAPPGALPLLDLLAEVRAAVSLPLLAAGGLASGHQVSTVLRAGAAAAQLGTAYLRTPESGASALHKASLVDPRFDCTVVTRAFSGRPARGLATRFSREHERHAPAGYPRVHWLTSPLRAAGTAAGDPDVVAMWAGTGHAAATEEGATELTRRLWAEAEQAEGATV